MPMLSRPHVIVVLAAVLLLGSSTRAADTRAEILAAVRDFGDAIVAGDGAKLTNSIWAGSASPTDARGREVFVKLVLAERRLERAAAARFGAEGARFRCHFSQVFTAEDRAALASAEVAQDRHAPELAWVRKPGETYAIRLRRAGGEGGRWQVVVEVLERDLEDDNFREPSGRPGPRAQARLEHYSALVAGVEGVTGRIEQGEYDDAAAAEADLFARFEQALQDYIVKRNALNTRGRGRYFRHYR